MESVGGNLKSCLQPSQLGESVGIEAQSVFTESVYPWTCEDESTPARRILNIAVPLPDRPDSPVSIPTYVVRLTDGDLHSISQLLL